MSSTRSPGTGGAGSPAKAVTLKILVVDDSLLAHEVMKHKLSILTHDYRLEACHVRSGEEALERIQAASYDIVFLDVEMPGLSGHDACRQIKAHSRKTRVAMLSGLLAPADRERAFSAGCDHYLEKPPKEQVLQAVVRVAGLRKELYAD
ncbi:MAG: response regulator transcription factor [Moraxellaceae bacterium]|jgi:CheY-like chemotaxis protein|nr:response regulator transcription factor [Moraxellaceae bacterium]